MAKDHDPVNTNPLTQPEDPLSPTLPQAEESETDDYQLTEVVRGRMLCLSHGRVCYRRVSMIGEKEWVCPDERHRRPIRS
jgi:hypothetical protein